MGIINSLTPKDNIKMYLKMKNTIKTLLIALSAIGFYGCQKDFLDATDIEKNRMFMTTFRQQANTGISGDPKASQVVNTNDMYLTWYGIEGAKGYRLQMKLQSGTWDAPMKDTIVGPDVLKMTIEDLQYSTKFNFAIQVLSPKGDEYNSLWYGYGDAGHADDRCEYTMGDRDSIPDVISILNVTKTSMRVVFDLTVPTAAALKPGSDFEQEGGYFLMDQIKVEPSMTNPGLETKIFNLTAADKARGYVDVEGLTSNAVYIINGLNNRVKRYWDRLYNTQVIRMKGDPGAPVLIPHVVDTGAVAIQNNASRLDTILNNYMKDNNLAEGTIFKLEAGKTYYLGSAVLLSKGLSLVSSDPNQRAIVLMGLGYNTNNDANAFNFSFGRNAESGEIGGINIQSIIFDGINFDAPYAWKYVALPSGKTSGTGNYFINQYSAAMPFVCESFEVRNCDFRRMTRGWVRIQGPNRKYIEKIVVDNCLFYDCGVYDNNGRGYPYFAGDGTNDKSNIFNNVTVKNSTFVDSPMDHFFSEPANRAWPASTSWNITLENNTFINWSTRSSPRYLFNMRYNPANSHFTVKKNLFILTKATGDARSLYMAGMDIRNFNGVVFDVADNYSTNFSLTNNQIFTSNGFNSTTQGAGYQGGALNIGGLSQTQVKLGTTPISPTDLMEDPNPISMTGADMHKHNLQGLYFKNTSAVRSHEIYTLGIGAPRWREKVTP
ncbi:MAG: hypothetical protein H6Q20_1092 [Bacteroidetes bacterium]|nr:hypothetical protein [Bacteroidota bacterium]